MLNSKLVFDLLASCQDEGEMEYVLNASADYGISNPKLGLSAGRGRVMAAKADIKHANVNYNLYKTVNNVWVLVDPLRRLLQELPKAIEYRTQRLINPQLPEQALTTELGILRMGMIGKCLLGTWVDPEQENLFYEQTRKQRLASYKAILTSN
jgi:hypothetical protein